MNDDGETDQESRGLVHSIGGGGTPMPFPSTLETSPPSPLALINNAINRGMSVADLQGLFDLQERFERQQAAQKFAEAITAFQSECPQIEKVKAGGAPKARDGGYQPPPAYHYAPYEEILRVAGPLMVKHGIVATFTTKTSDKGVMAITCRIRVGTHSEETNMDVPSPGGNSLVNAAQIQAMTLSYAKRYSLCAALNIVTKDEDNDCQVGDTINAAQVQEILNLIEQCKQAGTPVAFDRFKQWLCVEKLEELPQRELSKALTELRNKLAQAKKGAKK